MRGTTWQHLAALTSKIYSYSLRFLESCLGLLSARFLMPLTLSSFTKTATTNKEKLMMNERKNPGVKPAPDTVGNWNFFSHEVLFVCLCLCAFFLMSTRESAEGKKGETIRVIGFLDEKLSATRESHNAGRGNWASQPHRRLAITKTSRKLGKK